jgi:hypothetical protein
MVRRAQGARPGRVGRQPSTRRKASLRPHASSPFPTAGRGGHGGLGLVAHGTQHASGCRKNASGGAYGLHQAFQSASRARRSAPVSFRALGRGFVSPCHALEFDRVPAALGSLWFFARAGSFVLDRLQRGGRASTPSDGSVVRTRERARVEGRGADRSSTDTRSRACTPRGRMDWIMAEASGGAPARGGRQRSGSSTPTRQCSRLWVYIQAVRESFALCRSLFLEWLGMANGGWTRWPERVASADGRAIGDHDRCCGHGRGGLRLRPPAPGRGAGSWPRRGAAAGGRS